MPIAFERSLCCDLNETISREWFITNGLGGYAAGTIAGMLTRMQHGLLVATPLESTKPQLLLAKIDEEIVFDQRTYYLGTNEYRDGILNPSGFVHLETFRLEEGFPIFTYRIGGIDGIMLEKRIWMPHGLNTTFIQYRILRTTISEPVYGSNSTTGKKANYDFGHRYGYSEAAQRVLSVTLLPFSAYRPHNQPQYGTNDWQFQVQVHTADLTASETEQKQHHALPRGVAGCTIRAWDGAHPYHMMAVGHPDSQTTFIPTGVWYWHLLRRHDQAAGQPAIDDLYLPGVFRAKLWPGEDSVLTIIVTAEELSTQTFSLNQLNLSYQRCVENQHSFLQPQRYFGDGGETSHSLHILPLTPISTSSVCDEEYLQILLQAADRFLVRRELPRSEQKKNLPAFLQQPEHISIILSDYFTMKDSMRDMLIALPGITLATKHYAEAARLLRSIARCFKQGLLPDHFPIPGQPCEESNYGSADTALWFFYALDHYLQVTHDYELLYELYQGLVASIEWYIHGTYNGIQVDASDGLVAAQQSGKALTWMNAHVHEVPVTPRQGKPVEVNALWYYALSLMFEWSQQQYRIDNAKHTPSYYLEQSTRCKQSFNQRFWNAADGYLYDVIDGPCGDDKSVRPNQLLALSFRYPVLDKEHQEVVFDCVTQQLVTPCGLRTLAPQETGYEGHLKQKLEEQLPALHQGSVWPWLIGPYVDAMISILSSSSTASPAGVANVGLYQEYVWRKSLRVLEPFRQQFSEGMLGMIGGVFDGEAPHHAGYKLTSALAIGEILRIYSLLAHKDIRFALNLTTVKSNQ